MKETDCGRESVLKGWEGAELMTLVECVSGENGCNRASNGTSHVRVHFEYVEGV